MAFLPFYYLSIYNSTHVFTQLLSLITGIVYGWFKLHVDIIIWYDWMRFIWFIPCIFCIVKCCVNYLFHLNTYIHHVQTRTFHCSIYQRTAVYDSSVFSKCFKNIQKGIFVDEEFDILSPTSMVWPSTQWASNNTCNVSKQQSCIFVSNSILLVVSRMCFIC